MYFEVLTLANGVSFTDNRQIGERSPYTLFECTDQKQGKHKLRVMKYLNCCERGPRNKANSNRYSTR